MAHKSLWTAKPSPPCPARSSSSLWRKYIVLVLPSRFLATFFPRLSPKPCTSGPWVMYSVKRGERRFELFPYCIWLFTINTLHPGSWRNLSPRMANRFHLVTTWVPWWWLSKGLTSGLNGLMDEGRMAACSYLTTGERVRLREPDWLANLSLLTRTTFTSSCSPRIFHSCYWLNAYCVSVLGLSIINEHNRLSMNI